MMRADGMLVSSVEEVKGIWKKHFEFLMNGGTQGEAIVTSMGLEAGTKRVCEQRVSSSDASVERKAHTPGRKRTRPRKYTFHSLNYKVPLHLS